MFDRTGAKGATLFGVIDLTQGFRQIAMSKESRKLTGFITYGGLYQYTRLPFELKEGPSDFQHT